jgi:hypothetical protein
VEREFALVSTSRWCSRAFARTAGGIAAKLAEADELSDSTSMRRMPSPEPGTGSRTSCPAHEISEYSR